MYLMDVPSVVQLIQQRTLSKVMSELIKRLQADYSRWGEFHLQSRHASYVPGGVIELMPIYDQHRYACKLVNCHPGNPKRHLLSVTGLGFLVDVATGYPLLLSEMTLLTAIRTACVSALVAQYCAPKDSATLGILGLGAQAEFQVMAMCEMFPITKVLCFDPDIKAAHKFMSHMREEGIACHQCKQPQEAVSEVDICITTTARQNSDKPVVEDKWVHDSLHISAIGGDGPGKTELAANTIKRASVVVAYLPQTKVEGEIQQVADKDLNITLLSDLVSQPKPQFAKQLSVFDSVGFALEDYTVLNWLYDLVDSSGLAQKANLIPHSEDCKDLFSCVKQKAKV
jgi:ornithine cyclodeaminase